MISLEPVIAQPVLVYYIPEPVVPTTGSDMDQQHRLITGSAVGAPEPVLYTTGSGMLLTRTGYRLITGSGVYPDHQNGCCKQPVLVYMHQNRLSTLSCIFFRER